GRARPAAAGVRHGREKVGRGTLDGRPRPPGARSGGSHGPPPSDRGRGLRDRAQGRHAVTAMEEMKRQPYERIIFVCANQKNPGEASCANRGSAAFQKQLKEYMKSKGVKGLSVSTSLS